MKMNICSAMLWMLSAVFTQTSSALDLELEDKLALVTGSTSNIGYSIARALLNEGARVIINARSDESVNGAIESLHKETGKQALGFVGDMSRAADAERLARTYPGVEILVNNVGTYAPKAFEATTDEDWFNLFELNVMSGVRLSRLYLPGMKERNWGRIIFISSESALQIPVDSIHYGMTKAAQIAVARGLAESVAETGITVNSVLPGPTQRRDTGRMVEFAKSQGRTIEEMEKDFFQNRRPTSLIMRFAHPDEVASLVVYVASPLSSATTGAALRVDGGVVKSAF